jgi:hypothetical protein
VWRNPLLIAGLGEITQVTINTRTQQADLFVLLGSPVAPTNWQITIDGVEVLGLNITNSFAPGSTFSFILINGARLIGAGGFGGNGGTVAAQEVGGARGGNGGPALQSVFDVSMDCDDGYLLGGGGGGGGGATYHIPSTTNKAAGSGGGGGAGFANEIDSPFFPGGFFTSSPDIAGTGNIGVAAPENGTFGNADTPGTGGTIFTAGGDGGVLGSAGLAGTGISPTGTSFTVSFDGTGGCGGNAGRAFYGIGSASMTLTGAKSEATLRSEGRIKGQSKAPYFTGGSNTGIGTGANEQRYINSASVAASSVHGFTFKSDGSLQYLDGDTNPIQTQLFMAGTGLVGADFQVRQVSGPGTTQSGTWDAEAAAINTWVDLSADRTWSFTHGGGASIRGTARLFEIRRDDVPGGSDDEIIGRLWLYAVDYGGL